MSACSPARAPGRKPALPWIRSRRPVGTCSTTRDHASPQRKAPARTGGRTGLSMTPGKRSGGQCALSRNVTANGPNVSVAPGLPPGSAARQASAPADVGDGFPADQPRPGTGGDDGRVERVVEVTVHRMTASSRSTPIRARHCTIRFCMRGDPVERDRGQARPAEETVGQQRRSAVGDQQRRHAQEGHGQRRGPVGRRDGESFPIGVEIRAPPPQLHPGRYDGSSASARPPPVADLRRSSRCSTM